MPGQRYDTVGVAPLIRGIEFGGLIADKAFDSNEIIADLNSRGAKIVISQHPRRAMPLTIDTDIYRWRHLIENFFCKLKEFKRIALRADKTDSSFKAMIYLAAAVINSLLFRFRLMPLCFPCVLGAALLLSWFCGDAEARLGEPGRACQMPQTH